MRPTSKHARHTTVSLYPVTERHFQDVAPALPADRKVWVICRKKIKKASYNFLYMYNRKSPVNVGSD